MRTLAAAGLTLLALVATATAQETQDAPTIESREVAEGIYMLVGQGGNLGLSIGEDATFLIDDQFAPLTPAIQEAIRELGGGEVDFLLNTHFHGDHTGGNENFGKAGALNFAHGNVRERLSVERIVEEVLAAAPTADLDETWGDGFINGTDWITYVFDSLP